MLISSGLTFRVKGGAPSRVLTAGAAACFLSRGFVLVSPRA